MSNRTKSFFDYNQKQQVTIAGPEAQVEMSTESNMLPHLQRRPQFHRSRSNNDVPKTDDAPQKPAIPPCAKSKAKLKKFQFLNGRPTSRESLLSARDSLNKENDQGAADQPKQLDGLGDYRKQREESVQSAKSKSAERSSGQMLKPLNRPSNVQTPKPSEKQPNHTPKAVLEKTFPPATPATRLPLADLIGNIDDLSRHAKVLQATPEERIAWNHVPSQQSAKSSDSPGARGRKRAHSSSPAESSSYRDASKFFPQDPDSVSNRLKTPQADPVGDLWNKYTVGLKVGASPSLTKAASFAHLIEESSPQSQQNISPGGNVSGLRRWSSCADEFPVPNAKRRRTMPVFRDQDEDSPAQGRLRESIVPSLLEKLQEEMAKEKALKLARPPSGSSPLPDTALHHTEDVDFPITGLDTIIEEPRQRSSSLPAIERVSFHSDDQIGMGEEEHGAAEEIQGEVLVVPKKASDYGSSSFGSQMLGEVDVVEASTVLGEEVVPETTHPQKSHPPQLAPQVVLEAEAVATVVTENRPPPNSDDDFGDFGDDGFEELETLVSMYDTQPTQSGRVTQIESKAASPVEATNISEEELAVLAANMSDDFSDDDLDMDDFAAVEEVAMQGSSAQATERSPRSIKRYLITKVVDSQYRDAQGALWPEKVLLVEQEKSSLPKAITLRQSWVDTPCTSGSFVHVFGQFDAKGQCMIDDAQSLLILHPDHLISATVVADSFGCMRRAVLQDRVKATSPTTSPLVYGHILHEIFQECMTANRWDSGWMNTLIEKMVAKYLEDIYDVPDLNEAKASEYLKSKLPEVQGWARVFIKSNPGPDALVNDRNGKKILMSINKLLDVEEHVWSPAYGLKGNIDATVQIAVRDDSGDKTLVVPLEVKTGRNASAASHRAQTALYTLLLSDRYDLEITYGVLYYMETSDMSRIPAIRHEIRQMLIQRNKLATYVRSRSELPPMLQQSHMCGKCYAQVPCFVYHKLLEDGTGETSGLKETFDRAVKHLTPAHQAFFRKWDALLTKEEGEVMKLRKELWTLTSKEREKLGRCFGDVTVEPGTFRQDEDASKINRFHYTFIKPESSSTFSFAESQLTVGEPIVVSDEEGHLALANGYVTSVRKHKITVAVDRRLHNARIREPGFDAESNQVFAGIMDVSGAQPHSIAGSSPPGKLYRLDKDEFSNGMATVRNNLIQIMDDNVFRARDIRSLVIEGKEPTYRRVSTPYALSGPLSQMGLNSDQTNAIHKVMAADEYALVLGMPGTGKTTTIAHIIRALVAQGKSVLLTSYTHTAVDNILLKIRNDNIGILRLGNISKVHPEVQQFAVLAAEPKQSVEELERAYREPQVVATTCLGINHQIFHSRVFDYCIVDEASQITLPVCLGPIRMARKFILVGDHYQLPPLVQNREAIEGGLDVSLFKYLSDEHPESVINLEHQYRMCEDIMLLSNQLIYKGRLKCGNDAVAQRSLLIPDVDGLQKMHQGVNPFTSSSSCTTIEDCWIGSLLDPARKVVFANTDPMLPHARETAAGSRITNAIEVALTAQLVESLLAVGIAPADIGVITLYRSQLALMKQRLRHHSGIEMHTADKYQGRDKEVIILSCVRSNEQTNVGDLLKDWRRVNVALTRARSKLVVLGSATTLAGNDLLKQFLGIVNEKGWRYQLPANAVDTHSFGEVFDGFSSAQTPAKTPGRKVSPKKAWQSSPHKPQSSASRRRPPLKASQRSTRVPEQVGKMAATALAKSRPVLRDVLNDCLGGY